MRMWRDRGCSRVLRKATGISALLIASVATAAAQAPQHCKLDVLLTNDDGWNAPGIKAVDKALRKSGHRVTRIAPLTQQSGRGGALNTSIGSEVTVEQRAPGVWSVEGTPTDAVRAALDVILADEPPDLVISGSNFGPNLGRWTVHSSGTLGAALAAHYAGFPAIAVSTGVVLSERDADPPFASTVEGLHASARITVGLLDVLTAQYGCDRPMPEGVMLSVNVPVPVSGIRGVRYAPLSEGELLRVSFHRAAADGPVRVALEDTDWTRVRAGDDVDLFRRGFVTITPISGDLTLQALPASLSLPGEWSGLLLDLASPTQKHGG